MEKLAVGFIIFTFIAAFLVFSPPEPPRVLGAEIKPAEELTAPQPIHTTSRFETKLETQEIKIEKEATFKDDPEMELDEEKVLDEGQDGKKTKVYKVTYFEGKEYERELVSQETVEAKNKVIAKGSKLVWREVTVNGETIRYWRKLRVWATHYDPRCPGCNDTTAIGMKAGKGVIAVDPKVIKLRSKVYIPGYGQAVAGDTGGAIKGKIIDLGFDDARTAGWSARFVDVYLE
jgi:3D (Asp-Asp-Asp) domain-containing protein